jgi:hypothetical protein
MKMTFHMVAMALLLGACSTTQIQTASQDAAKAQQIISEGCSVVQPTLTTVQALDPAIAPFVVANGAFCAAASSVNVASIQTMIGTSVPAAVELVQNSTFIPADQKPTIIGALGAFQTALSSALIFLQPAMPAAPASGASAVSAS